jgi:hypothetical protein
MADWREAYRAANRSESPAVKYASGWFHFIHPGYTAKHRQAAVERMIRTLGGRAALSLEGERG